MLRSRLQYDAFNRRLHAYFETSDMLQRAAKRRPIYGLPDRIRNMGELDVNGHIAAAIGR